ncbi:hypothetical protein BX616_005387 [Lobosporangium transversale]|uniref:Ricin B lectin domain-containing protein n=1 Tax=Lobosporangium transversale TaxID=64571 RepID=A0A1Y2GYU6_9FUNG|nr:hypothetical protein BCR41DRAFT_392816 [Lobosporangium transversale]KAF9897543.1 hypothetical protein BX616_005387 [Lobosporangium transversale]ORZ27480.1 hypothetical protein BCR41DRAFT_392816 [Lobosporangium transversale]|eukprot:XP_021885207.1 hypothetical protein BCR41DRAFT_392816 [Lobosporangium transversale]
MSCATGPVLPDGLYRIWQQEPTSTLSCYFPEAESPVVLLPQEEGEEAPKTQKWELKNNPDNGTVTFCHCDTGLFLSSKGADQHAPVILGNEEQEWVLEEGSKSGQFFIHHPSGSDKTNLDLSMLLIYPPRVVVMQRRPESEWSFEPAN